MTRHPPDPVGRLQCQSQHGTPMFGCNQALQNKIQNFNTNWTYKLSSMKNFNIIWYQNPRKNTQIKVWMVKYTWTTPTLKFRCKIRVGLGFMLGRGSGLEFKIGLGSDSLYQHSWRGPACMFLCKHGDKVTLTTSLYLLPYPSTYPST